MESFSLKVVIVMAFLSASTSAGNFYQDVKMWGGLIQNGGQLLSLSLGSNTSSSGFESTSSYLYSRFDMQLKLAPGNSTGTVTSFFLSSLGKLRDEVVFELFGNSSGQTYTVNTNIFNRGTGIGEQKFALWFDPTAAFHTYTILRDVLQIIFMVDNIPIRILKSLIGVQFPSGLPMKMFATLRKADDWVKTNWSDDLFTAIFKNLTMDGCAVIGTSNSCKGAVNRTEARQTSGLDAEETKQIEWVQKNYMVYNYCADEKRFPEGFPVECKLPMF